jgi:hypothetical protein
MAVKTTTKILLIFGTHFIQTPSLLYKNNDNISAFLTERRKTKRGKNSGRRIPVLCVQYNAQWRMCKIVHDK